MRPEDPPQRESEKAEGRWLARKKLADFPARVLLRSRSFPDRRSKGSFAPRIVSSTTAPRRLPISSTESLAIAAGACATFYAAFIIQPRSPDLPRSIRCPSKLPTLLAVADGRTYDCSVCVTSLYSSVQ